MSRLFAAALGTLLLGNICLAQEPPADPKPAVNEKDFALTIYSTADPASFDPKDLAQQRQMNPYNRYQYRLPGYGVVRETRKIDLAAGENVIRFIDVAAGIDPTTVAFKSLTAPETAVLEQNYEYDLVNFDKLLEKFIGKQITITRNSRTFQATLLSSDPASIIYREGADENGPIQVMGRDPNAIQLPDIRGLNTKPTLVWKITTEKPGAQDAQISYQTDGLTWRADYNVVVNKDDTAVDVGAWVSILNESGIAYPNAKLKLVAGDVQRVKPPQEMYDYARKASLAADERRGGGFAEKSFFEYHLYTLGRTTSLMNNSTKQIELFPTRTGVPIEKTFVYYGLPEQWRYWIAPSPSTDRDLGTQTNKKVDIYLLMTNSEKNGMGMPLPAGRIRVYKQDEADANLEFIGEDLIQHTPKDEQVMIKLGSAFDIVGERKQTDFKVDVNGHWIIESFEIKLRNHKKEPVKVIVKENLYRWVNWEITASSDKHEKQDYRTIHMPVEIPVDGEKTVTYTVKYTW
jgi:hypothetical protein